MSAEAISEAAEWNLISFKCKWWDPINNNEIHKLVHYKNSFSFITDHAYNLNLESVFSIFIYHSEMNFNWQYFSTVAFNSQMEQKE